MPATSGRVRMPHNNRVHSSVALKMTGIWKDTIGYDPYAAEGSQESSAADKESAYEQSKGLFALARLSSKTVSDDAHELSMPDPRSSLRHMLFCF